MSALVTTNPIQSVRRVGYPQELAPLPGIAKKKNASATPGAQTISDKKKKYYLSYGSEVMYRDVRRDSKTFLFWGYFSIMHSF